MSTRLRRTRSVTALVLLIGLVSAAGPTLRVQAQASRAASAGAAEQQVARVDALMAAWSKGASPGAAVGVIRDGKVLLAKGYGLADLETGEAIGPDTVFDLASVSKQFTAMAVSMLVERGKLSLDDPLAKFFPNFPSYACAITVRHLLHHTSGIADYPALFIAGGKIDAAWQRKWESAGFAPTVKDVFELLAAQQRPEFAPGERFAYSNSNYVLLAGIIERASGKSYPQFLREQVFQPLGMSSSFVPEGKKASLKRLASRYDRTAEGFKAILATPFDLIYGDGNVHSTVADVARWARALETEQLVKASLLAQAFAPGRLQNGAAIGYGFGWVLDKYFGQGMAYHQGGGTGFNTFIMRVPEQRFTVIVLSNFARFNPFVTGRKLARIYLADKLSLPVAVRVAPTILQRYAGRYLLDNYTALQVTLEGETLVAEVAGQPKMVLLPLSETKYFVQGDEETLITFVRGAGGDFSELTLLQIDLPIKGKRL